MLIHVHKDSNSDSVSESTAQPNTTEPPDFSFSADGAKHTEEEPTRYNDHPTRDDDVENQSAPQSSILSSVTNAAYASIGAYAPQVVIDHLPALSTTTRDEQVERSPVSRISSSESFASAEDGLDSASEIQADEEGHSNGTRTRSNTQPNGTSSSYPDTTSLKSTRSETANSLAKEPPPVANIQERELAKLNERKKKLDDQLAKTREKELKDKQELTSKEQERILKAEEKHAREIAKQEEKYHKEVAKLEAKRAKETAKLEERRRKSEEKDEKTRLLRERDEVRLELDVVRKERDILGAQVRDLQRENTALVARIGKLGGEGKDLVRLVKMEDEAGGGGRSRSGSGSGSGGGGGDLGRRRSGSGSGSLNFRRSRDVGGGLVAGGVGRDRENVRVSKEEGEAGR